MGSNEDLDDAIRAAQGAEADRRRNEAHVAELDRQHRQQRLDDLARLNHAGREFIARARSAGLEASEVRWNYVASFKKPKNPSKSPRDCPARWRLRRFCSKCGSPVVTLLAEHPDLAFIKAGTLNDRS